MMRGVVGDVRLMEREVHVQRGARGDGAAFGDRLVVEREHGLELDEVRRRVEEATVEWAMMFASSGIAGGNVRLSFLPQRSAIDEVNYPSTTPLSVTMFTVALWS